MNVRKYLGCVFLCLVITTKLFGITTEDLSVICEGYESTIVDIQIEYEWWVEPAIAPEKAGRDMILPLGRTEWFLAAKYPFTEYSLSTERTRVTNGSQQWTSSRKQSYDGKKGKYLSSYDKSGTVKHLGTLTKSKRFIPHRNLCPFGFTLERFRDYPVSKLLEEDDKVILDTAIRKTNDFETISATFFTTPKKERAYLRLYFSPEHGYTLVEIEYVNKQNQPEISVDVIELQEVSACIWFPIKGRIGVLDDESVNLYKATKVMVNKGLTDDYFDFEFQPGTKVVDEVTGSEYIIRPSEEQFDFPQ